MPPNTVKVDRSTKWGNPFRVMGEDEYLMCDASHRRTILTPWVVFSHEQFIHMPATPAMAVAAFRLWLAGFFEPNGSNGYGIVRPCTLDVRELRGKNLACWCALGKPCHADVLLELANQGERPC